MAKTNGLGMAFYVGGVDISGDINSFDDIGGGPTPWETTDITQSAVSRQGLLLAGRVAAKAYFNPARAHPVLSALPRTDVIATALVNTTLGGPACSMQARQVDYGGSRGADGSLLMSPSWQSDGYPLEWGINGTAGIRSDTAATNGASVDNGSSSTFGLTAYIHVFGVTGTSMTVKIQDSSDNSVFNDVASLTTGAVAPGGAPTAIRVATANNVTINRYLRVTTTGTFNPGSFYVMLVRNQSAVSF